jgi:hypothetical protein
MDSTAVSDLACERRTRRCYGLTFGIAFAERITIVNLIAVLYSNRNAAKILVEVDEQELIVAFITQVHCMQK